MNRLDNCARAARATILIFRRVRVMKPIATGLAALAFALVLTACGSAAGAISETALGVTARDAFLQARTEARSWSSEARLRYAEGLAIAAGGQALPGSGEWRFHYTAPARSGELLVRVSALDMATEERAVTSPPGYVIGDNALDASWVDSPDALATVLEARNGTAAAGLAAEMLLVPTRPARWVVRFPDQGSARWVVNAETGTLLEGGP